MNAVLKARLRRAATALALACAASAVVAGGASAAQPEYNKEYEKGYEVGIQGYDYGEPLSTCSACSRATPA